MIIPSPRDPKAKKASNRMKGSFRSAKATVYIL